MIVISSVPILVLCRTLGPAVNRQAPARPRCSGKLPDGNPLRNVGCLSRRPSVPRIGVILAITTDFDGSNFGIPVSFARKLLP